MSSTTRTPESPAWQAIDGLLDRIAQLARGTKDEADFYGQLLAATTRVLAARHAAVWRRNPNGDWQQLAEHGQCELQADGLNAAYVASQPIATGEHETHLDIAAPVHVAGQVAAILDLRLLPAATPDAAANLIDVVSAITELAADFHARTDAEHSQQQSDRWEQFDTFLQAIHRRLQVEDTCYAATNEARRLLRWDRVSMLVRQGRRFRVISISGLDRIDRRSAEVTHLERLTLAVARTGEPLWERKTAEELPPQLVEPLSRYVDHSSARTVIVLPLADPETDPRDAVGAMVFERFDEHTPTRAEHYWMQAVTRHGGMALRNAVRWSRIPGPIRGLGATVDLVARKRWLTSLLLLLIASGIVAALTLIPAELEVYCRGVLRPVVRHEVFAPLDGSIEELLVDSGSRVERGEVLLRLQNSELDFEAARINGDLQTTRTQLAAVQASMSSAVRAPQDDRLRMHQLAADEERLVQQLKGLEAQRQVLARQQSELRVVSPIAGEVLTFDLADRLTARPVRRGQRLLTVAKTDGKWELQLSIADHDLGHVLQARADREPLAVTYVLSAAPLKKHDATLTDVGLSTELDDRQTAVVTASASLSEHPPARAGATVAARIHCGQHPLGYVWLRDLIEVMRLQLW